MKLACPGCGSCTIAGEVYGSYEICSVCGWEDDAVQLANPCSGGGANKESLYEHQNSSANENRTDFERDPLWRRLNAKEVAYFESAKRREYWAFIGETDPKLSYWRKPPVIESA